MKILKWLLSLLSNEFGTGGKQESTTEQKLAPLTPEESLLNQLQFRRKQQQIERAKGLYPYRQEALEANLGLGKQRIATQQAGQEALGRYLTEDDLSKARDQLRLEIIQDVLDKEKGLKGYVSDREKAKLKQLESSYKAGAEKGITGLQNEILDKLQGTYQAEGLLSGNLYKKLMEKEAGRQTASAGRQAGMLSAKTLMNLPAENRARLINQYEPQARTGLQDTINKRNIMSIAAGLEGQGAGAVNAGVGAGTGSLSSTLNKLEQARLANSTQTTVTTQEPNPLGGAMQGLQTGLGLTTAASSLGLFGETAAGSTVAAAASPWAAPLIAVPAIMGAIYG